MVKHEKLPDKSPSKHGKESATEKTSRWLRNINALGAIAAGAVALIAPPALAVASGAYAGINAAQAGGFELLRRHAQKSRLRKEKAKSGSKSKP